MSLMIQLTADSGKRHVTLNVDDHFADKPAIDFVFDVLGVDDLQTLVTTEVLSEADLPDMRAMQSVVFERDSEGFMIRDGMAFLSSGSEIDPDKPLSAVLTKVDRDGLSYRRCDMSLRVPGEAPASPAPAQAANTQAAPAQAAAAQGTAAPNTSTQSREEQMQAFGRMLFLHQIARGFVIDVTKDDPDLIDVIAQAEKEQLIEIDVAKAAYKLTAAGQRLHDNWMSEAQELIHRYDIYGDVDMDSSGTVRFDSHVGQDWRVAVYELADVDPFKARFLLGLNDGEWDHLDGWQGRLQDMKWYEGIFAPVENAPSVQQIGRDRLRHVMDQAKGVLREDGAFQ
jgi:hypothetical protein